MVLPSELSAREGEFIATTPASDDHFHPAANLWLWRIRADNSESKFRTKRTKTAQRAPQFFTQLLPLQLFFGLSTGLTLGLPGLGFLGSLRGLRAASYTAENPPIRAPLFVAISGP